MKPIKVVLLVLIVGSCMPSAVASRFGEMASSWPNFSGRTVPADTATYVAGLDVAGTGAWLTESWFTTGHSHTGLFKSSDGGKTWFQELGWDGWPRWQKHFSAASAVVVAEVEEAGYRLHARLLSTVDGGADWSARDLPVRDDSVILSADFVNPDDAWLLLSLGSTGSIRCGQVKQGVAILRTEDGGASWSEILRVDAEHPSAGGMSVDGVKDGISFASPTHGYLTTSGLGNGNVAYATDDRGDSWRRVMLPFDQSPGVAYTHAPKWLSTSAGLVTVQISPEELASCAIPVGPPASPQSLSPGPWTVEAPSYLVAPYPGSLLLQTTDGGASWSTVAESSQWGDLASYGALDQRRWAVVSGGDIWTTSDAGSTWETNSHVLDPRCSFLLVRFIDDRTGLASAFCQAVAGVIEGCEHTTASYMSDWDCPPVGTSMFSTADGGKSWTRATQPSLK